MHKQLFRLFYIEKYTHRGEEYNRIEHITICATLDQIKRKYFNIYYLTDINGNVIIDNRKVVNE